MANAFEVIIAIEKVIEGGLLGAEAIVTYVQSLIAQYHANSDQEISALHDAALAAANAEAPQGKAPLT
jgi:hypothetical protein